MHYRSNKNIYISIVYYVVSRIRTFTVFRILALLEGLEVTFQLVEVRKALSQRYIGLAVLKASILIEDNGVSIVSS